MAITLVTPGTAASSGSAFSGGLTSAANDAPFSFGALLSLQLSGLPIAATAPELSLGTEASALSDEATASLSIMDSGELLAGMLAVSSETTYIVPPQEEDSSGELTASGNTGDASLFALFANLAPTGTPAANSIPATADENGTVSAQVGVFESLGRATSVEDQLTGASAKPDMAANFAADTATPSASLPGSVTENIQRDFAAASLVAQSTSHAHTPTTQASTDIRTPLRDENWSQSFGESIVWLSKNNQQSAQLNINPPELGPVQIHLKLNGDQATAAFASPHAEVRQAIEDAMPRLRELLAGAGIDLGQTNVGSQMAQQERGNQGQTPDSPRFSGDKAILREDIGSAGTRPVMTERSGQGMVDLFG